MRILFVDDEPRILDGLRRLLRSLRDEWDIHFADGGAKALELMASLPMDVIVTDMHMPGMSGAELLAEVRTLYPDTIRIVLSGHAETDAVMQTFGIAQQYLTKPCDQQLIRTTVKRALALRQQVGIQIAKDAMGSLSSLPALPAVYQQLVGCLKAPDATLADVAAIVREDIAMTVAILKVVNSAYFGLAKPITAIERAVSFLGINAIMALVLQHDLFGTGRVLPAIPGFDPQTLRRKSMRTAAIARRIAREEVSSQSQEDDAFLAGLLHHVGKLSLAAALPDRYVEVGRLATERGLLWRDAEREILQTTHAEVGAYLLGLWGFHDSVIDAVLFHDNPSQASSSEWGLPGIVHVAGVMASNPQLEDPDDPRGGMEVGYLADRGLVGRWSVWRTACREILDGSAQE